MGQKISIFIMLLSYFLFGGTPNVFILKSTSTNVAGPEGGFIVCSNGSSFIVQCEIVKNQLIVKNFESATKTIISQDTLNLVVSDNVGVASNISGNVKYFLDFYNKTFYLGQVNVLLDRGCIITKTSVGDIVY